MAGALKALEKDRYTPSARKSVGARFLWWERLSEAHGGCPFPLDKAKLRCGAARLKERGYHSAAQCLYTMNHEHLIWSFKWSQSLSTELRD